MELLSCNDFKPMWDLIPISMRGEVGCYVKFGMKPSTFLFYIFTHKFYFAFHIADEDQKKEFCNWFKFLKYSMPVEAHGSDEKVILWQRNGGLIGRMR